MTEAIWYVIMAVAMTVAISMVAMLQTQVCGWGIPVGVLCIGLVLGMFVGLVLARLMNSMIVLTEANALGRRRYKEMARNQKHEENRRARDVGGRGGV